MKNHSKSSKIRDKFTDYFHNNSHKILELMAADRKSGKANKLEPGQTYAMYVEHAIFTDTQNDFGMPGFATLASSTYMNFQTLGMTDPNYCMRDSK